MDKIKKLLTIFLLPCIYAASQDHNTATQKMMDSIKSIYIDGAALKFPALRQFSFSQEITPNGNIQSGLYGKTFFKGRLGGAKTAVNLNIPILENKKNAFVASIGAVQQYASLNNVVNYDAQHVVTDATKTLTTFNTTLNYGRHDSLFGMPVLYNLGVTGLFNATFSRQRIMATGLVSFTLIQKENTSLMGGLVGIIDPSSPVPAFLFFSYYHRFRSANTELMVNIPSRIAVRKELTRKASLTLSGDLVGNNFFLDIDNATLPQKALYSLLTVKCGLLYEYRLTKKAVISFSGGFQSTLTSKIIANGENTNNYFIKNNNAAVPYFQVGFSLLPFFKLIK